jgi:CRP/FNR family transcriptional regulator, nitrogen oxide reductase regulator
MHENNDRIMRMATQQVEQRMSGALLRLINQSGHQRAIGIEIDFPVSRVLSAWQKSAIVQSERRTITVVRPHQLVLLAPSQR